VRPTKVILPANLSAEITAAARRAHPSECCGLLEGIVRDDAWVIDAVHETANLAEDARRRFLVDPAIQFALLRKFRGSGRSVAGCFHSHPDGVAEPSENDRSEASEDGFLWVIAAGNPASGFALRAHVFHALERRFSAVVIAEH
jgi:proteasome lid subunit RPN8/RPN11